jgi:Fe2+ transport system protein B
MALLNLACSKKSCRNRSVPQNQFLRLTVALADNPNTGKSTVFNALTGLRQHTGNWPGKTVQRAEGNFYHRNKHFTLVDLPGTYSLFANSVDEQVARDYICFARPDVTVVVTDATCLERNLNLVLQVMEITPKVVVCLNLMDEAERKKICVDVELLSSELGVPVVATAARSGRCLDKLMDAIDDVASGRIKTSPRLVAYDSEIEQLVQKIELKISPLVPEGLNPRWVALRLLDGDRSIIDSLQRYLREGKNSSFHWGEERALCIR